MKNRLRTARPLVATERNEAPRCVHVLAVRSTPGFRPGLLKAAAFAAPRSRREVRAMHSGDGRPHSRLSRGLHSHASGEAVESQDRVKCWSPSTHGLADWWRERSALARVNSERAWPCEIGGAGYFFWFWAV